MRQETLPTGSISLLAGMRQRCPPGVWGVSEAAPQNVGGVRKG